MYSSVASAALCGLKAEIVKVEADVGGGLPSFDMGGFLGPEVKEARERVRVAIKNSGINLKPQKIMVNISPANIKKDGTGFDLPIAISILMANEAVCFNDMDKIMFLGELGLNGEIKAIRGVLPCIVEAKERGIEYCMVPTLNFEEALIVEGIEIIPVNTLREAIDFLNGGVKPDNLKERVGKRDVADDNPLLSSFDDIKGQEVAKRATATAVAGMHNIMYMGPPGSGKTMLAQRIPGIMPDMTFEEKLSLTNIYSVAGHLMTGAGLLEKRPFRAPYHNVTKAAFLGGGSVPRPGEVTLSGKGVLFLDEMTEFKPDILESLRQPLEDKKITIVRMNKSYQYPADFMLVGAINPCKCGFFPDRNRCNCSEVDVRRFLGKISNPIWDRFDICIHTEEITYEDISGERAKDSLREKDLKDMVERARNAQLDRFSKNNINYNSEMSAKDIAKYCELGDEEKKLIDNIYKKMNLTARGYHKILKTARTIADMNGAERIDVSHLTEACMYRNIPRTGGV